MAFSQYLTHVHPAESNLLFARQPSHIRVNQQPCRVDVPSTMIADLQNLIQQARLGPATYENSQGHNTGPNGLSESWIKEALDTWASKSKFDWHTIQHRINGIPHFISEVKHKDHSYSVHYMALWSQREDAVPLVCIHGWPGCFLEYLAVAELLKSRYTPETLPYHFIVPSVPGYTFSSGPPVVDFDFSIYDVSCIFQNLFVDQLGFDSGSGSGSGSGYIVAGGDIGSRICRALVVDDESCIGVHLTFCFDQGMQNFSREGLDEYELQDVETIEKFINRGAGYAVMHATRPATTGLVLSSSPVALLAWIAEKFLDWTDKTPDTETILAFVTLYWLTDTISRSLYPYRNDFAPDPQVPSHGDATRWLVPRGKPFGFSHFPKEILPPPKAWVEKTAVDGMVSVWRKHEQGGHFPGIEVPEVLLEDLENFVQHVMQKKTPKFLE